MQEGVPPALLRRRPRRVSRAAGAPAAGHPAANSAPPRGDIAWRHAVVGAPAWEEGRAALHVRSVRKVEGRRSTINKA